MSSNLVGSRGLPAWIEQFVGTPPGWVCRETRADGCLFENPERQLRCIISGCWLRGGRWIHFSLSHRTRLPTWEELVSSKEAFLGEDTKAIQVLPPRGEWVNICERVLHLFHCVDGDGLPDFTEGTGSL